MAANDEKIWPIRIDYRVRANIPILLNDANVLIRFDDKSTLSKRTIFDKLGQVAQGAVGKIVDYGDHEIAVAFPSGLDWSTFTIWINRGAFSTFVTNIGPAA